MEGSEWMLEWKCNGNWNGLEMHPADWPEHDAPASVWLSALVFCVPGAGGQCLFVEGGRIDFVICRR